MEDIDFRYPALNLRINCSIVLAAREVTEGLFKDELQFVESI